MTILDIPLLSRLRRNHGLEHATLSVLAGRSPRRSLSGWSTPAGFFILGAIGTEELREGVMIALSRLQQGEARLAVHPNCGTNLAVSGLLAGLLAWLGMAGARDRRARLERLPLVIGLAAVGLAISQPLGALVQERITTSGDPLGLAVVDVSPLPFGRIRLHRVVTRG